MEATFVMKSFNVTSSSCAKLEAQRIRFGKRLCFLNCEKRQTASGHGVSGTFPTKTRGREEKTCWSFFAAYFLATTWNLSEMIILFYQ